MEKLKIINKDGYMYNLINENNNEYVINLEFFDLEEQPKIHDVIYINNELLNPKYDGIVFFSDYSWYDGNVYVESGEVTNNKNISYDKLEEKNYYINYITKKNDLALKFNYFKI